VPCALASIVVCALAPTAFGRADATIDDAIAAAVVPLLGGRELAGSTTFGEQALVTLTLVRAGRPLDEVPLDAALKNVFARVRPAVEEDYGGTYSAGLVLMLLEELGERASLFAHPDLTSALTRRMLDLQCADGGWGDMSRTEFAALGLDAAERLGGRVGADVWHRMGEHVVGVQHSSGGWGYRRGDPPTGSMTAAALVALHCAGIDARHGAIAAGTRWLEEHFTSRTNPGPRPAATSSGASSHRFYYLLALTTVARVSGSWPSAVWAEDLAGALVMEQQPDGSWAGEAVDCPTAFSLTSLLELRTWRETPRRSRVVRVGIVSAPEPAARRAIAAGLGRGMARWTGARAAIEFVDVKGSLDAVRDLPLAVIVAGDHPAAELLDTEAFAAYVTGGGVLVLESPPGAAEGPLLELGRRTVLGCARASSVDAARGSEPALVRVADSAHVRLRTPFGTTTPPRLFCFSSAQGTLFVAPDGLFMLLGDAGLGIRSGAMRMAVNVLAHALSR
jgi:hypothetical protein